MDYFKIFSDELLKKKTLPILFKKFKKENKSEFIYLSFIHCLNKIKKFFKIPTNILNDYNVLGDNLDDADDVFFIKTKSDSIYWFNIDEILHIMDNNFKNTVEYDVSNQYVHIDTDILLVNLRFNFRNEIMMRYNRFIDPNSNRFDYLLKDLLGVDKLDRSTILNFIIDEKSFTKKFKYPSNPYIKNFFDIESYMDIITALIDYKINLENYPSIYIFLLKYNFEHYNYMINPENKRILVENYCKNYHKKTIEKYLIYSGILKDKEKQNIKNRKIDDYIDEIYPIIISEDLNNFFNQNNLIWSDKDLNWFFKSKNGLLSFENYWNKILGRLINFKKKIK